MRCRAGHIHQSQYCAEGRLLPHRSPSSLNRPSGFTLIELILVIAIIGLMFGIIVPRFGAYDYWKEEAAIRRLSETVVFLHNQAIMDQAFYRMEFDLQKNMYRVGVMRPEQNIQANLSGYNLSYLTMELAALLSPSLDADQTMIPPPSFPSLAEPNILPGEMFFTDIVTPRGKVARGDDKAENPFLIFSPRGFSEFGVIHLEMGTGKPVTVFVNPWTGLAELYRDYREFEWTLGKNKQ